MDELLHVPETKGRLASVRTLAVCGFVIVSIRLCLKLCEQQGVDKWDHIEHQKRNVKRKLSIAITMIRQPTSIVGIQ